jgi:hypothetical protein
MLCAMLATVTLSWIRQVVYIAKKWRKKPASSRNYRIYNTTHFLSIYISEYHYPVNLKVKVSGKQK